MHAYNREEHKYGFSFQMQYNQINSVETILEENQIENDTFRTSYKRKTNI